MLPNGPVGATSILKAQHQKGDADDLTTKTGLIKGRVGNGEHEAKRRPVPFRRYYADKGLRGRPGEDHRSP